MDHAEDERKVLEDRFHKTYRSLKKKYGLRSHESFDIFGNNLIEIWEYKGERKGRRVCKVEEETPEECLRRATGDLEWYAMIKDIKNGQEEKEDGKRAV